MSVELEGHTSRAYDGALSALHLRVVELGGLVLRQVADAAQGYTDWDRVAAQAVLERESTVNEIAAAIEGEALQLIARRQPVAADLRSIFGLTRAVAELERAGDESKKIAMTTVGAAGRAGERPGPATARDARHLAQLAVSVMRLSLEALDRVDHQTANLVVTRDRELDAEYAAGLRRLLTRAMEDSRNFSVALEAAFVLKSLERIGDHARNVARVALSLGRGADRDTERPLPSIR
jgi:phosphate transport system protein